MKKRLSMLLAVCCLMAAFSMPASALEYTFERLFDFLTVFHSSDMLTISKKYKEEHPMKKSIPSFVVGLLCGMTLFGGSVAYAAGVTATPTWQPIYVDGQQVSMTAYNIGGKHITK